VVARDGCLHVAAVFLRFGQQLERLHQPGVGLLGLGFLGFQGFSQRLDGFLEAPRLAQRPAQRAPGLGGGDGARRMVVERLAVRQLSVVIMALAAVRLGDGVVRQRDFHRRLVRLFRGQLQGFGPDGARFVVALRLRISAAQVAQGVRPVVGHQLSWLVFQRGLVMLDGGHHPPGIAVDVRQFAQHLT